MFFVPIDSGDRIRCRQIGVAFSGVVVDCSQTAHRPIGNVGSIFLRNLVVALNGSYTSRLGRMLYPSERAGPFSGCTFNGYGRQEEPRSALFTYAFLLIIA